MYEVRLFKGLREPYITAHQLIKAEYIGGFWKKLFLLLFLTFLLSTITAYYGIGNELLSKELNTTSSTEFEAAKSLFAGGQIIWSILVAITTITIPSVFFWAISDIEWKKYIVVQSFILTILLIETIITIPFAILIGLPEISNPFSLGAIGQSLTSNDIILQLLTEITIFKIWAIVLQIKYIKVLAEKTAKQATLIVIGFNLIILVITVFLAIMDLEKLL
ncbi:hypothetical protein JMM81_06650 [Bacillus sp. V3B]|uniref:hypothetical protein n=1 Tax=Bacillus sp. V3B TaxID=2804915 RepID=UPI0021096141|nr:hypothetical protein [Bacillus sp. V3B]MCQ6274653.1 hypothetical protein [Bacillus sp. V3B]